MDWASQMWNESPTKVRSTWSFQHLCKTIKGWCAGFEDVLLADRYRVPSEFLACTTCTPHAVRYQSRIPCGLFECLQMCCIILLCWHHSISQIASDYPVLGKDIHWWRDQRAAMFLLFWTSPRAGGVAIMCLTPSFSTSVTLRRPSCSLPIVSFRTLNRILKQTQRQSTSKDHNAENPKPTKTSR